MFVCRRASVLAGGPERGKIAAAVGRFLRHTDGHSGQTTRGLAPAGQVRTCSQLLLYCIILCILGQTFVLVHNFAKQAAWHKLLRVKILNDSLLSRGRGRAKATMVTLWWWRKTAGDWWIVRFQSALLTNESLDMWRLGCWVSVSRARTGAVWTRWSTISSTRRSSGGSGSSPRVSEIAMDVLKSSFINCSQQFICMFSAYWHR